MPPPPQPPAPNHVQVLVDASVPGTDGNVPPPPNSANVNYVIAAYRVGMLALERLATQINAERPHVKFSRTPSYGDDVKWLHGIAMKLGKRIYILGTFLKN